MQQIKEQFVFTGSTAKYNVGEKGKLKLVDKVSNKENQQEKQYQELDAIVKHIQQTKQTSYQLTQQGTNNIDIIIYDLYYERVRSLTQSISFDDPDEANKYYKRVSKILNNNVRRERNHNKRTVPTNQESSEQRTNNKTSKAS